MTELALDDICEVPGRTRLDPAFKAGLLGFRKEHPNGGFGKLPHLLLMIRPGVRVPSHFEDLIHKVALVEIWLVARPLELKRHFFYDQLIILVVRVAPALRSGRGLK